MKSTTITFLKVLFFLIFLAILSVNIYASFDRNILRAGDGLWPDRWFIATLTDAYLGFITFYVWVAYKEKAILAKIIWFILIMALGNLAMSSYVLIQLFRLKSGDSFEAFLLRRS